MIRFFSSVLNLNVFTANLSENITHEPGTTAFWLTVDTPFHNLGLSSNHSAF